MVKGKLDGRRQQKKIADSETAVNEPSKTTASKPREQSGQVVTDLNPYSDQTYCSFVVRFRADISHSHFADEIADIIKGARQRQDEKTAYVCRPSNVSSATV